MLIPKTVMLRCNAKLAQNFILFYFILLNPYSKKTWLMLGTENHHLPALCHLKHTLAWHLAECFSFPKFKISVLRAAATLSLVKSLWFQQASGTVAYLALSCSFKSFFNSQSALESDLGRQVAFMSSTFIIETISCCWSPVVTCLSLSFSLCPIKEKKERKGMFSNSAL